MSHTLICGVHGAGEAEEPGTVFHYNPDLSGDVEIRCAGGIVIAVPGQHLLEFVAESIRQQHVSELQDKPWREILGLEKRI